MRYIVIIIIMSRIRTGEGRRDSCCGVLDNDSMYSGGYIPVDLRI
jgi:hypothetical protein